MPEWNDLTNEDRMAIEESWEVHSCPHSCGGDACYVYDAIRTQLIARERRYLAATMNGPSLTQTTIGDRHD